MLCSSFLIQTNFCSYLTPKATNP